MFYGCEVPKYDSRDYTLNDSVVKACDLPPVYIPEIPVSVKNQLNVSSCVAHAMSSILEWHDKAQNKLSTNFLYGIQKKLFNKDTKGMYLRDVCKIVRTYGNMLESDCRYNTEIPYCRIVAENAFRDSVKLKRAEAFRVASYYKCRNIQDIKYALCNHGPVLCCLKWYTNYHTDSEGVLVGKKTGDFGYHAVMIYGYNETGFLCQNSWGINWGDKGRFILPYSIKIREARGFVDWDNVSSLSKPKESEVMTTLYKSINSVVNWLMDLVEEY